MAFMGKGSSGMFGNPFIKKVAKEEQTQTNCATYAGITAKCLYFMALIFLGGAAILLLDMFFPKNETVVFIGAGVAGVLFLICPFVTIFARKTTPVTGSMTFLSTGYLISLIAYLVPEYRSVILLAAVITVLLVLTLQVLFSTGIIRVNAKLRSVVCACLLTMLLAGLMLGLFALIPALRPAYVFVATNPAICIGISLIYIVFACMCLLSDFYTVQSVVEGGMPRNCEWYVAFSLSYTVVWLFMEILDLLMTIKRFSDD